MRRLLFCTLGLGLLACSKPPPLPDGGSGDMTTIMNQGDMASLFSFFVTSTGSGPMGGNLGGLVGADAKCQTLATAVGAGNKTWAAFLGTTGSPPRDRIGGGPWYNVTGKKVAEAGTLYMAPPGGIRAEDALTEKGESVPVDERAILTGSSNAGGVNAPHCTNWTDQTADEKATAGLVDASATDATGDRWNNGVVTTDCTEDGLKAKQSSGRVYCFATN